MLGTVLLQHLLNLVRDLLQDQPGSFAPVFHAVFWDELQETHQQGTCVFQPLVQQDLARVVHAATLARPHVKGSAQAKEKRTIQGEDRAFSQCLSQANGHNLEMARNRSTGSSATRRLAMGVHILPQSQT